MYVELTWCREAHVLVKGVICALIWIDGMQCFNVYICVWASQRCCWPLFIQKGERVALSWQGKSRSFFDCHEQSHAAWLACLIYIHYRYVRLISTFSSMSKLDSLLVVFLSLTHDLSIQSLFWISLGQSCFWISIAFQANHPHPGRDIEQGGLLLREIRSW